MMNNLDKKNYKYLGIDWGEVRIGLGLGDGEVKLASPYKVVGSIDDILKVIEEEKIDKIVIGRPFKMDGSSDVQKKFLDFLSDLRGRINIPIIEVDERLSSKAADALIGDRKTKAERDALAAMLILQLFFDSTEYGRDL